MNNANTPTEDYQFLIKQAIKAPSGHNTQPWIFKINEEKIEISPDFKRSLPVVDPDNRELFISLGCATENLCIAASLKGYTPQVNTTKDGHIFIKLETDKQIKPSPLAEQISIRQTNRSLYSGKVIPDTILDELKETELDAGVGIHFYAKGTKEFDSISNFVVKGNTLQMQDEAFREELKSWMRFNKKHQDRTNDGLSYAVFGAPNLPLFIVKPIISSFLNAEKQNKGDIKKMQSSSHFVLFTTQDNTQEQWINLGRSLERFLLKSTQSGISHAYLNQPNEIKELSVEMTKALNLSEYPTIILRLGYGERQPYSKRIEI
ncbi:nitroreductase [Massilibacteroides sp.]|uniref:Acg family FMN-binding oxidoreductase n=1 Tax=Massilibacteroides sp. TaxID=2034766 RepID=UPI0026376435|nr:nitroreductase [Massilibacteroides sp.]MDD4514346.1 nitroreductase [Massilibacteroides sp.]